MKGLMNNQAINQTGAQKSSGFGNSYLFTARRFDDRTGLYYYRNRYYESTTGQFLSRDPLGLAPDEEQEFFNLYHMTENNPVSYKDALGLDKNPVPPWWEYIPGLSFVYHAVSDPEGIKLSDYQCRMNCAACPECPPINFKDRVYQEGVRKCKECIARELSGYMISWLGTAAGTEFGAAIGTIVLNKLSKKAFAKKLGSYLILLDVGDLAIVTSKAWKAYQMSKLAEAYYCGCDSCYN